MGGAGGSRVWGSADGCRREPSRSRSFAEFLEGADACRVTLISRARAGALRSHGRRDVGHGARRSLRAAPRGAAPRRVGGEAGTRGRAHLYCSACPRSSEGGVAAGLRGASCADEGRARARRHSPLMVGARPGALGVAPRRCGAAALAKRERGRRARRPTRARAGSALCRAACCGVWRHRWAEGCKGGLICHSGKGCGVSMPLRARERERQGCRESALPTSPPVFQLRLAGTCVCCSRICALSACCRRVSRVETSRSDSLKSPLELAL